MQVFACTSPIPIHSLIMSDSTEALRAAMTFHTAFKSTYAQLMTEVAHAGEDCQLRAMNEARDYLVQRMSLSKRVAANMIRAFHIGFCDDIGAEVPAAYRSGLVAEFEANILPAAA